MGLPQTKISPGFLEAHQSWLTLLGPDRTVTSEELVREYEHNCCGSPETVQAVIFPKTVHEVQRCVSIAHQHRLSLFPVSTGKNWGYGTKTPHAPHQVVLDLRHLNTIEEVNTDLAFAKIQAGVTQQQLYDYLLRDQIPLLLDVTSSSPEASVLANTLERGFGHTPYGDRFAHCSGLEVVLPDGSLLSTGMGRFPNAKTTSVHRWGLGPSLDGLFSQSNLGVAVGGTVWLLPKPECQAALTVEFASDQELLRSITTIRELRMGGVLRGTVHIANHERVASASATRSVAASQGIHSWTVFTGLWGTRTFVRAMFREVVERLRGYRRIRCVDAESGEMLFGEDFPQSEKSSVLETPEVLGFLRGIPSDIAIRGLYRHLEQNGDQDRDNQLDPVRDGCGLIWCSPVIPCTEQDFLQLLQIGEEVFAHNGVPFSVNFSLINERSCCATIGIHFDRGVVQSVSTAQRCHEQLLDRFLQAGYPPYRSGSRLSQEVTNALFSPNDPSVSFFKKIKQVIDPNGVIARGRFGTP